MTRGDADTAERQHLHAPGRVSSLHLLILPIPDRYDISCLSNLRQRWARKMPLHRLVPPTLHSQATERVECGPVGRSRGTWDAGAGVGNVECGNVKCWPVCRAAPTPHYLAAYAKAQTSLRKDFSLVGLCFPPKGGFYRVVVDRGESKGQDRGKCRTYARSKGYEARYHNHDPGGRI